MPNDLPNKSFTEILSDLQAHAAQPKELLTTKEAANCLNVSTAWFERDRWSGKRTGNGPLIPYVTVGNKAVRYRRSDLEAHIINNLHGAPDVADDSKGGQSDD